MDKNSEKTRFGQACFAIFIIIVIFAEIKPYPPLARKNYIPGVDPDFIERQKASLVRKNRQVIYLNDKEMAAIDEYCARFKVRARAVLLREAVMEKVLSELDNSHPTLF